MLGNVMASISEIGGWAATGGARVWMAVAVTVGFAMLARLIRGVSASGAVAGAAGFLFFFCRAGVGGVLAPFFVFFVALVRTPFGFRPQIRPGKGGGRGGGA